MSLLDSRTASCRLSTSRRISLARWYPERPFADPLCGSGTLPIEAALYGLNIAPGIKRHFDAEQWPTMAESIWREARKEALDLRKRGVQLNIHGSDVDPAMINLCNHHARRAGVADQITFEARPVKLFGTHGDYGTIVTNPPYGERLGSEREVAALTRDMARAFRAGAPTWGVHVLTAFPGFEALYGPAPKKRKLYNGKLRCDLFSYPGPRRPRPDAL